jgi:hypothetical protein
MRLMILFSIAAGAAFAGAGAVNAQTSAPTGPVGSGLRSQDVAYSHREFDNDYNVIANRGVEVTNMDRADQKHAMKRRSAVPATASDIVAGAKIRDVKGVSVGVVATLTANEVADPDQVVIDTGQTKIGVPLSALGKDDKGLLLSITAGNFHQLVAQANTQTSAQTKSN